jgi:hypothetical protein
MKTRIKVALTAPVIAGLFGGLGTIAKAHADEEFANYGYQGDHSAIAYRDELRYVGLHHEDVRNARDLAGRLCGEFAEGYNTSQVFDHLDRSPDGYTTTQEVAMVDGALYHFCPHVRVAG